MALLLRKLHENRVRFPARSARTNAGPRFESFSRPCRIMVLYVLAIACFCSASQHATPRAAVLCSRPQSPSVFVPDQRHTPLAYLCLNATPGRVVAGNPFFFCTSNATVLEKKHYVDIHAKRTRSGETALDRAESPESRPSVDRTEVAAVLRGYGATRPRAPAPTPTPCVSIMKLSHTNK